MTHHHRDQGQGLQKALQLGINIWVPHMEQDLFQTIHEHWQGREIYNSYNNRQDRFSILENVSIAGTLKDYHTYYFNEIEFKIAPTPGHSKGSITILTTFHGSKIGFSGDLIYGSGKVWSLAATQWGYNDAAGIVDGILSLWDLKDRQPDLLCPSHGEIISEPGSAIDLLIQRFRKLLKSRSQHTDLEELKDHPFESLTRHLLMNKTSCSFSYVLISESGKTLIIDYGYDFFTGSHEQPQALLDLVNSPRTFAFFDRFLGGESMAFDYKWARAVATGESSGAHYDVVYMGRSTKNLYTLWTPLGDVPYEMGGLAILLGSQRFDKLRETYGEMDVDRDNVMGSFSNDPVEVVDKFGGRWASAEYKAGDAIIFGMYTMHGSLKNMTNRYRLSADTRYQLKSEPVDERWVGAKPKAHYSWGQGQTVSMEDARKKWGV